MLKGLVIDVDLYHSSLVFPQIQNSLFALDVQVVLVTNKNDREPLYKPMMKQQINNHEIKYYRGLEAGTSDRITFHQESGAGNKGLLLDFFSDDQTLQIKIKFDWYGTMGRCVLRYGAILMNFLWVSTLLVLLTQLYSYCTNGKRKSCIPNSGPN
jgi:hypothetical protein